MCQREREREERAQARLGPGGVLGRPSVGREGRRGVAVVGQKEEGKSEPVRLFYFPIPFLFPRIQM
jgi:hypothetical protein